MCSRLGASVLYAMDTPELVCENLADYEELAVTLAEDSEKLFSYRRKIERSRLNCAAFDTNRWLSHWESALNEIVRKLESGELMTDISITDNSAIAIEVEEELLGVAL